MKNNLKNPNTNNNNNNNNNNTISISNQYTKTTLQGKYIPATTLSLEHFVNYKKITIPGIHKQAYQHKPTQTTNYKLRTTNYKLQTTNYELQTTNYKLP
jgi:hypothetical protein